MLLSNNRSKPHKGVTIKYKTFGQPNKLLLHFFFENLVKGRRDVHSVCGEKGL